LIDVELVERLVAAQFPQWATLAVRPVALNGWDNQTFRLGDELSVRLPSAAEYALAIDKEHRWLPVLAPHLPLPIPVPVAVGTPGEGYPERWSVYRWLDGTLADAGANRPSFARELAGFLTALREVDPTGGPRAGVHNWYRGGPLTAYDAEARAAARGRPAALEMWEDALRATFDGPDVWFHGDVAVGNLLVDGSRLAAVIDFGTCGVGDPACDLAIAWTLFTGDSREVFRTAMGVDDGTWVRGRAWALWKALITGDERVLDEILS
jgi:aminoglycoside phosphotransferase (APT) family kinase protein